MTLKANQADGQAADGTMMPILGLGGRLLLWPRFVTAGDSRLVSYFRMLDFIGLVEGPQLWLGLLGNKDTS